MPTSFHDIEQLSLDDLLVLEKKINARKQDLTEQAATNRNPLKSYNLSNQNVVIIGGAGQLGSFFYRLLDDAGAAVSSLEKEDWQNADKILANATLVLVAVPIHFTNEVISKLDNLSDDCLLADITSIKTAPVSAMLRVHKGPVIGLHPMFGPGVDSLTGQTVVVCESRSTANSSWLVEFLSQQGAELVLVTPEKHDQTMAIVQVLRHFSTVVYGCHLADESEDLERILSMSSPIYRLELAMVGRLFAQNPDLYTEIIFANKDNIAMMKRYIERYSKMLALVEANDKEQFKIAFKTTTRWFGEFAKRFLDESSTLLKSANEHKLKMKR